MFLNWNAYNHCSHTPYSRAADPTSRRSNEVKYKIRRVVRAPVSKHRYHKNVWVNNRHLWLTTPQTAVKWTRLVVYFWGLEREKKSFTRESIARRFYLGTTRPSRSSDEWLPAYIHAESPHFSICKYMIRFPQRRVIVNYLLTLRILACDYITLL